MTTPVIVAWIAVAVSVLALAGSQFMYARDMHWVRRHASRFPMFAVRDELVAYLAEGHADEGDTAWCATYSTVNSLLELQRNSTVWALIRDFVQHRQGLRRNPERRALVDAIMKAIRVRAASDKRFEQMLHAMHHADWQMTKARLHWWDWVGIQLIRVLARILLVVLTPLTLLSQRSTGARNSKPADWYLGVGPKTTDDLVSWCGDGRKRRATA